MIAKLHIKGIKCFHGIAVVRIDIDCADVWTLSEWMCLNYKATVSVNYVILFCSCVGQKIRMV